MSLIIYGFECIQNISKSGKEELKNKSNVFGGDPGLANYLASFIVDVKTILKQIKHPNILDIELPQSISNNGELGLTCFISQFGTVYQLQYLLNVRGLIVGEHCITNAVAGSNYEIIDFMFGELSTVFHSNNINKMKIRLQVCSKYENIACYDYCRNKNYILFAF